MMRKIPTSINTQFNALLNKNNIPKRYQNHYLKWLRYYLDFCHKYGFSESNPQSMESALDSYGMSARVKSRPQAFFKKARL